MTLRAAPVVLITGASSGIGLALARAYYGRGASVVLVARRLERLEAEILALGADRLLAIRGDVTSSGDMTEAVRLTVDRFGRLDIVIANAGISAAGSVESTTDKTYRNTLETNLFGVLHVVLAAVPVLRQSRGRLAIVGSMAGSLIVPGAAPYVASKWAVRGLAETLRTELAPEITVTHVAPGFVASEIRGAQDPIPTWLVLPTAKAAETIVQAIARGQAECLFPRHAKVLVGLERHVPWLSRKLIALKRRLPRRTASQPRVVLITGAASGIGAALAETLVARGLSLVLCDRDTGLTERWQGHDRVVTGIGDVRDRQFLDSLVTAGQERFGPIDTAIANAGIVVMGPMMEQPIDRLREVFDVNVHGTLATIQATLPSLRGTHGRLLIVGSASGYLPYAGLAIYNASKFAVRGLTKQLTHEVARDGILVTHVAPGAVATNIWPGEAQPGSMSSAEAATVIAAAMDAGQQECIFPARTRRAVWLRRHLPALHARLIRGAMART